MKRKCLEIQIGKSETINKKTDNTRGKDRQYTGKRQTIQGEKTDNYTGKRQTIQGEKDRQYKGKRQTIQGKKTDSTRGKDR